MSEPDEAVSKSAVKRSDAMGGAPAESSPRVQRVTLQSRGTVEVPEDDARVANLVRMGLSEVEARKAVSEVNW